MSKFVAAMLVVLASALSFSVVSAQEEMADEIAVQVLGVVEMDGIPEGIDSIEWTDATVVAVASEVEDGFEITIFGADLVAEGLYTSWAVNEGLTGMSVAPAGGTPENEFRATEDGFGFNTVFIPTDEIPDALALAYHSDDQTYGDNPGPMGEVSFTHVMGGFPAVMAE